MTFGSRAVFLVLAGPVALRAQKTPGTPTAPETNAVLAIMTRVAANTAAALDARRRYVYHQKVHVSLLRTNGRMARQETREYTVIPQEDTTGKTLTAFSGEYLRGGQMMKYAIPGVKDNGDETERHTIESLTDELVNAGKARDGIPHDLFPLEAGDLRSYRFTMHGETDVGGRRTFDILFEPVDPKGVCARIGLTLQLNINTGPDPAPGQSAVCRQWKGEAWIDAEDYQPVRIVTKMARGVPWGVRVFLGTNIRQFGFSINYIRVVPGVCFPKSYGTEFGIDVLWGYKRNITLSMENGDFRKTDASSTIRFEP